MTTYFHQHCGKLRKLSAFPNILTKWRRIQFTAVKTSATKGIMATNTGQASFSVPLCFKIYPKKATHTRYHALTFRRGATNKRVRLPAAATHCSCSILPSMTVFGEAYCTQGRGIKSLWSDDCRGRAEQKANKPFYGVMSIALLVTKATIQQPQ